MAILERNRRCDLRLALALLFFFLAASSSLSLSLLRRPTGDTLIGLLPVRVWTSDLLHAVDLPLWFPYARYDFHLTTLHLVSHYGNPIGLALAALFRYDVWTLAVENILWRVVGLAGAYLFAHRHVRSPLGAAVVGSCYVGSGIVVASLGIGTWFAGLMCTPWLFLGIDHAVFVRGWGAWCRGTGILALSGSLLVLSGGPFTWITAPFLLAPYALWSGLRSRASLLRLMAAAALGCALAVGMLALFISETFAFPLFGSEVRNTISTQLGVLPLSNLFGFWLANPSYAPSLKPDILVPLYRPIYVGLLPALLLCARLAPWHRPMWRHLRPLVLSGGVLIGLLIAVLNTPILSLPGISLRRDEAAMLGFSLIAIGVFPGRMGRWERVDIALLLTTLACVVAATPNPIGDWLRTSVPPFSIIRWNYAYLWVTGLTLPLLAWRAGEQFLENQRPILPVPEARLRAWAPAWLPVLGLLVAASLFVRSGGGPEVDSIVGPLAGWPADRVGTVFLLWQMALVLVAVVGRRLYLSIERGQGNLARWIAGGALFLLTATLLAGRFAYGNMAFSHGYNALPAGGQHILDIALQLTVLTGVAIAVLHARSWQGIMRGAAIVAVFDISLAGARYLSDDGRYVAWEHGPASVPVARPFDFTGTQRLPRDTQTFGSYQDLGIRDPSLLRAPDMFIWPGIAPHVAELDRQIGEPSIFHTFGHFPASWRAGERSNDVIVGPDQFRAGSLSEVHTGADARVPVCPARQMSTVEGPSATVTQLLSSIVTVDVVADCERLLVYTDSWAPGWQARIDGQPAPVLRVDGAIRGVIVPAGQHALEWRYRPVHLVPLLTLMGACALLSIALVAAPMLDRFQRRRIGAATNKGAASAAGVADQPAWAINVS